MNWPKKPKNFNSVLKVYFKNLINILSLKKIQKYSYLGLFLKR